MNKTSSKNKGWILHLFIVIVMYIYYASLWYDFIFYDGKAGWKGFGLFMQTIFSAPIYIIFHVAVYFISGSAGAKKVKIVSLAGLVLCILHICAVAASM